MKKFEIKVIAYKGFLILKNQAGYSWDNVFVIKATSLKIAYRKAINEFFADKSNAKRKPYRIVLEILNR